jgi:hypothetical protein
MPIPFQEELSARALAETPVKALMFLGAVSSSTAIRDSLLPRGFTQAVRDRYWRLLHDATGQQSLGRPSVDDQVRAAVAEVAAWEDPSFKIARAALSFDFPDAFAHVFTGLEAASGLGSLVSVMRFLDRLDDLERSPERKGSRKTDQAALAKLAERGITAEERARVRRLVLVAERSGGPEATPEPPAAETADGLVRLRAMYDEWAEIARIVVTRRSDLIRLGLAKRRRSSTKSSETPRDEVEAVTPTPPPVAVASPAPVFTPAAPPVVVAPPAPVPPAPVVTSPSPLNGSPSNGVVQTPGALLPS